MLEKTLHEVVGEQLVERAERWILNMIQLETSAIDIRIAVSKCSNTVIVLAQRVKP
jgi:hypothetical protein